MKEKPKLKFWRRSFAIFLIVIGVFALITPFTPGSWLALIGLGILLDKSPEEVWIMIKEKISSFRKKKD
jgi:hypothetical protein